MQKNTKHTLSIVLGLILFVLTLFNSRLLAQEHLITEISYPYLEKLIAAAKANYPKYKSFDKRLEMAQDNIDKAKKTWFDFINFSMSYSPSNTVTVTGLSLSGYQIGFGFNLGAFMQKKFNVKQVKDEKVIAQLNKEEYELSLEAAVKKLYFTYIQQVLSLKLQNQSTIDIEASYKQIKYKFEKAEETFDNYNKALISYTAQKQNVIALESAVLSAKVSLEELVGKKLEEIR